MKVNKRLSKEQAKNCKYDPLITSTYSKDEFKSVLLQKIQDANIGEEINIILGRDVFIYKKVASNKIKQVI